MPAATGNYVVRVNCDGYQQNARDVPDQGEQAVAATLSTNGTRALDLAADEATVERAAQAMLALRFDLWTAEKPTDEQLAKAALAAAGRGT